MNDCSACLLTGRGGRLPCCPGHAPLDVRSGTVQATRCGIVSRITRSTLRQQCDGSVGRGQAIAVCEGTVWVKARVRVQGPGSRVRVQGPGSGSRVRGQGSGVRVRVRVRINSRHWVAGHRINRRDDDDSADDRQASRQRGRQWMCEVGQCRGQCTTAAHTQLSEQRR